MMNNNTVKNFFEAQAKREQEAKNEELKAMVDAFGIDMVLATMLDHLKEINEVVADIQEEENPEFEEAKRIIPTSKYSFAFDGKDENNKTTYHAVEFSEKTKRAFKKALEATNMELWTSGEGNSKSGKITHKGFAQYVIEVSDDKPEMLIDIINILKKTSWDVGTGITQQKMEIVYHALMLHRERRAEVIPAIIELLTDFDQTSLKVTANQCDEFRNHLSYKEKMMMFVERKVCEKIGEQPLFEGKKTA